MLTPAGRGQGILTQVLPSFLRLREHVAALPGPLHVVTSDLEMVYDREHPGFVFVARRTG